MPLCQEPYISENYINEDYFFPPEISLFLGKKFIPVGIVDLGRHAYHTRHLHSNPLFCGIHAKLIFIFFDWKRQR